jgi:hypothetical protein
MNPPKPPWESLTVEQYRKKYKEENPKVWQQEYLGTWQPMPVFKIGELAGFENRAGCFLVKIIEIRRDNLLVIENQSGYSWKTKVVSPRELTRVSGGQAGGA